MWASSVGRRLAWSGSGVVTRSSVISYNSDNGVIRPQPRQSPPAFPQLTSHPQPDFFMGK